MNALTHKTVARKTVPVTEEHTQTVAKVRTAGSLERAALAMLGIELSANPSEAEVLQALIEAGRVAVQEQAMVTGYAALAAAQDDEDEQYKQAMRTRRRGLSED